MRAGGAGDGVPEPGRTSVLNGLQLLGLPWQAERMATMERAEAIAFLTAGTRTGKLATASRSGAVSVAPVWFVLDDTTDEAVFTTGANTLKGRHLTENPRAALTVDVSEFPYHFVV